MVRIVTIFVLVFVEELWAESESSTEEDFHMNVRSLSSVDKSQSSLLSKEDAEVQEELLKSSDEFGDSDKRLPRLSKNQLNVSHELDFSKELQDYRRSSLLSEATVLRRRVRSQAARRKRLENQSRKSHQERTKKTPKDEKEEKEDELSAEKEAEDTMMATKSEKEQSHEDNEDDESHPDEKQSNLSDAVE